MKFRTIVIEDDKAIRELLELSALLRNHEVLSYSSATFCALSQGLSCRADDHCVCSDVLITDHMMPGMTGLEFVGLLKENDCLVRNRALVTAIRSEDVLSRAEHLGCHVIRKPFRVNEICTWLEESERNVRDGRVLVPREKLPSSSVGESG